MTQTTDHGPSYSPTPVLVQGGRRAALVVCLVRGATAAGLGLGVFAVLVMVVWISSPYPDSGPSGALHVAAGLWLLAHGTELVRPETLSGQPAPVGVVPLLLTVLPVTLIHRAARDGLLPDADGRRPTPSPAGAVCAVSLGYLLVGAVATLYATAGSPAANPLSALVHLPLVTVVAALAGVWTARGRPSGPLPGWLPASMRVWLARSRVTVALRSAVAGTLVLLGGGALLVASALVWHADATQDAFLHLADGWAGRLAVLLLGITLVPNASVWGAAYGLGPGFTVGTGAVAAPLAVTGDPALPYFPLIAAIPAEGPGTPLNWACAVVPVIAALVIAAFTVASAAPRYGDRETAWGIRETAYAALLGAIGCGVLMALAAGVAGGAMGTERLVAFGPVWWTTGAAALCWSAVIAVPAAVVVRVWRVLTGTGKGAGMGMGAPRRQRERLSGAVRPESESAAGSVPPIGPGADGLSGRYDFLPEHPSATGLEAMGTGTGTERAREDRIPEAPGPEAATPEAAGSEILAPGLPGSLGARRAAASDGVEPPEYPECPVPGRGAPGSETRPESEPEERKPEPEPGPGSSLPGRPVLADRPWAAPASPWPEAPGLYTAEGKAEGKAADGTAPDSGPRSGSNPDPDPGSESDPDPGPGPANGSVTR
ncbi:cell division protein PerM [Streptomyces katsurahamanus]|uniref:cell division protein PerM n=1 Tax=Streptomyces katsurahamanus TaxID=2577098 RepID=UPI001886A296|nr:DUF6350 family protein [Streptomyces katsurahamanus]